jgi:hypothetical protein
MIFSSVEFVHAGAVFALRTVGGVMRAVVIKLDRVEVHPGAATDRAAGRLFNVAASAGLFPGLAVQ